MHVSKAFLKEPLEKHVSALPIPVKILRSKGRNGLVKARLMGAKEAKGNWFFCYYFNYCILKYGIVQVRF